MKTRTKLTPFLLLFFLLTLVACSAPAESKPSSFEITDHLGRTVTFEKMPQTIISVAPSNTEMLYSLGLADRVIAVTDYDDYPPEVKSKPTIGGFSTPNIEQIIAYGPDVVLAGSNGARTFIPQLESKGVKVVAIEAKSIDKIIEAIQLIGRLAGKDREAASLTADLDKRIKAITQKTESLKPEQRLKVFYPVWHDPLMAGGVGTLHDELIAKAGGINISSELTGYAKFSLETVIQANPDIMFAGTTHGSNGSRTLEFLKNDARLAGTSARQENRVYSIDDNLVSRASPRTVDGLEQLARYIHPEIFGR